MYYHLNLKKNLKNQMYSTSTFASRQYSSFNLTYRQFDYTENSKYTEKREND